MSIQNLKMIKIFQDRQKYIELIESVGGIISDQITLFDEASTHLICPILSRNEKMLASVAAGKWVLHTSYLEDSAKAGHFLNVSTLKLLFTSIILKDFLNN